MPEPVIPPDLIDADAQKVIRRLVRNGYEAYLVGGCVRDLLLSRKPKDFDVATSATPSEVRDLFRNCRIIGRRFRLAHVFFGSKIIETATFRANPREVLDEGAPKPREGQEGAELLIRHDNVFGTAEEDARRRDFTINGLFYDLGEGRVIDYVGGMRDLESRSVRTIGDPDIRFQEDPVRILRAIKFAARLGFDIEDQTYRAVIRHRQEISKSAPPRVLEEIYRLLRGGAALESLLLLRETGLLGLLVPPVDALLRRDPAALDPFLGALDAAVGRGEQPQNAVLLCLLLGPALLPLASREGQGRGADAVPEIIEEVLEPLLAQLQATRREGERARLLLLGQRRVSQVLKGRGPRAPVVRTDWFQEALLLHALLRAAAGAASSVEVSLAEIQPLRHRAGPPSGPRPGPAPAPTASEALDEAEGPDDREGAEVEASQGGPRRRRRRRRRRPSEAPGRFEGDDAPVENEDAALAAFAAAMRRPDE